jgi:transcriptional regulator with XRE-family HTH domain
MLAVADFLETRLDSMTWFWLRGASGAGNALAGMRRERGMTQAELARYVGANRTTMIAMEAGRPPGQERFFRAVGWLGYDLVAVPRGSVVTVVEPVPASPTGSGSTLGHDRTEQ